MSTTTSKLALTKPDYRDARWDLPINANLEILDGVHGTVIAVDKILETTTNGVDAFIYDTSKDSDGGAWRKRCQDLSWYNETLNTSTRGATREFPAVCLVVAETNMVTLYDLADPSVPMWMVFETAGSFGANSAKLIGSSAASISSVTMKNGILISGDDNAQRNSLTRIEFLNENTIYFWGGVGAGTFYYRISDRNVGNIGVQDTSDQSIVNSTVNAVATTVLPNAPIDQITGLPVPTILTPTAAGASWIKGDRTVVDATGAVNLICADLNSSGLSVMASSSTVYVFNNIPSSDVALTSADYITSPVGTITSVKLNGSDIVLGTSEGFIITKYNEISPTDSMAYQITKDYFSGIMKGDIKLASLADSVEGVVANAIPNGDFSTGSTWTTGEWVITGGQLTIIAASSQQSCYQVTTLSGKRLISLEVVSVSGGNVRVVAGATQGAWHNTVGLTTEDLDFTTGQLNIQCEAGVTAVIEAIYEKNIEDRSVNDNPLQVTGTITKAAVASGSEPMAYSGFSATDYIEQPYNSDLDFGTGDFYVMGWLYSGTTSGAEVIFNLSNTAGSIYLQAYIQSDRTLRVSIVSGGTTTVDSVIEIGSTNRWIFTTIYRKDGVLYILFDALLDVSIANTRDVTLLDGGLTVGANANGSAPLVTGKLSLFRVGAGAPSDEQIQEIYEQERMLFEENAEYLLPSDNVQALDFDNYDNTLVVGTDTGVVRFKDLRKIEDLISVDSQTSQDIVAVSSNKGTVGIVTVAETGIIIPTLNIREEVSKLEGALNPLIEDYEHMGKFIPTSAITADHTIDIDNDRLLIVAAVTSDIDITLPLLSSLVGRHYQLIEFVPVLAGSYRVRIKCQGSDTFPFGNTWFDLPTSQKHFAIGLHEHGFNLRRNITVRALYFRDTDWGSASFATATGIPWETEPKNTQDELIDWSSSTNPERVYVRTSGSYDISGGLVADPQAQQDWQVDVSLYKNGVVVPHATLPIGGEGNNNASLYAMTPIDLVTDDYIEIRLTHSGTAAVNITSAQLAINIRL